MNKFHFTNKAIEDLASIWNYTFDNWSEQQADIYYKMLIDSCQEITKNPLVLGKRYDQIAENIYGYRAISHIIFYRIISDTEIEIIRIIHNSMDLKNRIKEK
jgi:toxin ParE1/3/4